MDVGEEPPRELLRFRPSQTPPVNAEGRPMPWAVEWTAEDFAAFLRARVAWRGTHLEPLPGLPARERVALHQMDLPAALVAAEDAALKAEPDWAVRATARRSNHSTSRETS